MQQVRADIVIFGGGIAGLWTLARLRQAGFSVLLFETKALGGIQTIVSQGIIHGGAKYTLTGNLTESARAIGAMPGVWRACLEGTGELDLSRVRVLSEHQYLWSTTGLVSRMAGFFAGKAMRSRMTQVEGEERPAPFRHPGFKGTLYRLEEQVLDMVSLVSELVKQLGEYCYQLQDNEFQLGRAENGNHLISVSGYDVQIETQRLIFTAGKGNAGLLQKLGRELPAMQLRPLHMVVAKGDLPPIHAHCLGSGTTPRITVTSAPMADGRTAWCLGGEVAESGVERSPEQQIVAAKQELAEVLPWIDIAETAWSSFMVERAEPKTTGGLRPESCYLQADAGVLTAWPTKLAFAPRLAQEILATFEREGVAPQQDDMRNLHNMPRPDLALPPWEVAG